MPKGEVMGQIFTPHEGAEIGGSVGANFGTVQSGDMITAWINLDFKGTRCQIVNLFEGGASVFVNAPGEDTRREALIPGQTTTVDFNGEDSLSIEATSGPLLNFYVQTESLATKVEG